MSEMKMLFFWKLRTLERGTAWGAPTLSVLRVQPEPHVLELSAHAEAVGHGLLLEVHVHVIGVEPRRLVAMHLWSEWEQEAVGRAVKLGAQGPGVGGEAAKLVAVLLGDDDQTGSLIQDGGREFGEALTGSFRVEERSPLGSQIWLEMMIEKETLLRAQLGIPSKFNSLSRNERRSFHAKMKKLEQTRLKQKYFGAYPPVAQLTLIPKDSAKAKW